MSRVLVEIFIPAIGKAYDLFLPVSAKVSEIVKTMSEMLSETDRVFFEPTEDTLLCDRKTGQVYGDDLLLKEITLNDGKKFMLI